jgi:crotonobetainyl-CoA:carnitine CoA-transferase CaiB-like acyl-CoA transferase
MDTADAASLPLAAVDCVVPGRGAAADYACALLTELGAQPRRQETDGGEHPALTWADSGLMALTGAADGPPQMLPIPLAACADGALNALAAIAPGRLAPALRGAWLLAERAAAAGHSRAGAIAPGGSCRLLQAADGHIAINLARAEDWALLPAWLHTELEAEWPALERALRAHTLAALIEQGRLLGLAVAAMQPPPMTPVPWYREQYRAPNKSTKAHGSVPLVVDLSSLWAGPLCGHLLLQLGARVIKVESIGRPDGARLGPAQFYDLLNADKASVALDFNSAQGRSQLRALLARADIVIEASRPRALRQLGIVAEELVEENPQLTWLSISGYGRGESEENWVAFGDDAGVAAGLSHLLWQVSGAPLFCADAIADPLAGLHAALLAWSSFCGGGGRVLAVALHDVVAHCAQFDLPASDAALRERCRAWSEVLHNSGLPVQVPRLRTPAGTARALGSDTAAVLTELGIPC